jgi:ribosomal protein S25
MTKNENKILKDCVKQYGNVTARYLIRKMKINLCKAKILIKEFTWPT